MRSTDRSPTGHDLKDMLIALGRDLDGHFLLAAAGRGLAGGVSGISPDQADLACRRAMCRGPKFGD
jgi:hypothetical protein